MKNRLIYLVPAAYFIMAFSWDLKKVVVNHQKIYLALPPLLFATALIIVLIYIFRKKNSILNVAYQELFENNPNPMLLYDRYTFQILLANKAAENIYGYSFAELKQLGILDLFTGEEKNKVETYITQRSKPFKRSATYCSKRKDGESLFIKVNSFLSYYKGKQVCNIMIDDMSEKVRAKEELQASQQLLTAIIDSSQDAIWAIDKHLNLLCANKKYAQAMEKLNLKVELGQKVSYPDNYPNLAKQWEKLYNKALKGTSCHFDFEMQHPFKKGKSFIETSMHPILINNKITGLACFARDITEKKQQEIQLQKALEYYELLSKATNDALWDLDYKKRKVNWSQGIKTISQAEVIDDSYEWWRSKIHPEDRERVAESFKQSLRTQGSIWNAEYRLKIAEEDYRYVADRCYILYNDDKQPVRAVGSMKDIQEKKEYENEIRLLSLVASKTDNGIIIFDVNGRITWVNEGFEKLSGYKREEISGLKPQDFLHGEKTDIAAVRALWKGVDKKRSVNVEIANYRKNGSLYWARVNLFPIFDEKGNIEKFVELQLDITASKSHMLEIERQNKLLMQIAHISAHEIRSPLTNILGLLDLLCEMDITEQEEKEIINYMFTAANQLDKVIHLIVEKSTAIFQ